MISEEEKESLRQATILVILDIRAQYLANGASALKHWEQLTTRVRSAAKQATTAAEWVSQVMRKLQIEAPSSNCSENINRLVSRTHSCDAEWLDLVEREVGYLIAACREEAEARQEARKLNQNKPVETMQQ